MYPSLAYKVDVSSTALLPQVQIQLLQPLCVQQQSRPAVMSLLSSIYAQLWFQLLTLNQAITEVTNAFLWTVRDKPVIAARQCGETKFPLFETIC